MSTSLYNALVWAKYRKYGPSGRAAIDAATNCVINPSYAEWCRSALDKLDYQEENIRIAEAALKAAIAYTKTLEEIKKLVALTDATGSIQP